MPLTFKSFVFDKPVYTPGETISLSVSFESTDLVAASTVASAVSVHLSDADGSAEQTSDGSAAFPDLSVQFAADAAQPVTASATDTRSPSGTWVAQPVSFTGTSPTFTGTVVLTSVA